MANVIDVQRLQIHCVEKYGLGVELLKLKNLFLTLNKFVGLKCIAKLVIFMENNERKTNFVEQISYF